MQVRKHHSSSLKKGKYAKHSIEMEEVMSNSLNVSVRQMLMIHSLQFQKLTDKYVKEVDRILGDLQKSMSLK